MVAGTHLIFSESHGSTYTRDYDCTAGAVLTGTGILSRITPYQRAVRYVATTKHCGGRGAHVRVYDVEVGTVIWESPDTDLSIIRIEPLQTTRRSCYPTSAGIRCTLTSDYEPRARSEVLAVRNRSGQESSVPVAGTKVPDAREIFCTSGYITGIMCNYVSVASPPGLEVENQEVVAETFSTATRTGDSGGPVLGRDMKLIGIIGAAGLPGSGRETYMSYVPMAVLFREQPYYALAM